MKSLLPVHKSYNSNSYFDTYRPKIHFEKR
jgi:hypothetical protein